MSTATNPSNLNSRLRPKRVGRKRLNNAMLPPGVYQHGRRFRLRVYIGQDKRAAWHTFKARSIGAFFSEWSKYLAKKDTLFLRDIFDRYYAEVSENKADASKISDFAAFCALRPVFGAMAPADVKPWHVASYIDERGKVAPIRANREKALLSHVFTKCLHWGLLEANPAKQLHHRNPEPPRTRYVTDSELRAAYKSAPAMIRYAMALAAYTGLRRRDLLAMRWEDYTPDGLLVELSKSRRAGSAPKRLLFQNNDRIAKLFGRIFRELSRPPGPVFDIAESSFAAAWTRFQARWVADGHVRFQLKDLRAKHATDTTERGGDATRHLGHSSAATTRRHYQRKPTPIDLSK